MNGKRHVAIISDAASTGISLHASRTAVNQVSPTHLLFFAPFGFCWRSVINIPVPYQGSPMHILFLRPLFLLASATDDCALSARDQSMRIVLVSATDD